MIAMKDFQLICGWQQDGQGRESGDIIMLQEAGEQVQEAGGSDLPVSTSPSPTPHKLVV